MTVIQGLGYPNNGKYIGEDERLWKKFLVMFIIILSSLNTTISKGKNFSCRNWPSINIWYFFYQIEYRIMGDLEESGKYHSFCKQLKNHLLF